MSVISWKSGRIDRVCRSATCAETRAIVDLEGELSALQYQWSEMLGNSAMENSPDEVARPVPGACVTDSKGHYFEMQHTVITPKGKECRVDIECPGSEGRVGDFLNQVFLVHGGAQLGSGPAKDTETEPFASFLKNGRRWRVIFDTQFMSSKKRGAAGISTQEKPSEEDMNVEGPLVMVLHMSASTVHVHRLNILSTSVTLHES